MEILPWDAWGDQHQPHERLNTMIAFECLQLYSTRCLTVRRRFELRHTLQVLRSGSRYGICNGSGSGQPLAALSCIPLRPKRVAGFIIFWINLVMKYLPILLSLIAVDIHAAMNPGADFLLVTRDMGKPSQFGWVALISSSVMPALSRQLPHNSQTKV